MTMADSRLHDSPRIPKLEAKILELKAQLSEANDKLNTEIAEHTREVLRNGVLQAQLAEMKERALTMEARWAGGIHREKQLEAQLAEAENEHAERGAREGE